MKRVLKGRMLPLLAIFFEYYYRSFLLIFLAIITTLLTFNWRYFGDISFCFYHVLCEI